MAIMLPPTTQCRVSGFLDGRLLNGYMSNVIVWDIETVPDIKASGHFGKSDDEVRAELGDKFPKHIYHSIETLAQAALL